MPYSTVEITSALVDLRRVHGSDFRNKELRIAEYLRANPHLFGTSRGARQDILEAYIAVLEGRDRPNPSISLRAQGAARQTQPEQIYEDVTF